MLKTCDLCGRASNQPSGVKFDRNGYFKTWVKPPALLIKTVKVNGLEIKVCAECVTKEDLGIPEEVLY